MIAMDMNLANRITIARIILIPIFLVVLLGRFFGAACDYVACGIFVVASLTDTLDGYIARSRNMVTTFGKFMDPLADKLLVCSALIAFIELGRIASWAVIIIISRELIVQGFRTIAASQGIVLAADWSGKIKTVLQMLMIIAILLNIGGAVYDWICLILLYGSLFFTVYSMFDYIIKNRKVLTQ